jgi:hypothetical protein
MVPAAGKTRSAIEAIDVIVGAGEIPILHVVPNSLIEQTVEEYTTWLGTGWVDRHLAVLDGKLSITQRAEALSGLSKWFSYGSVYLLSTEALSYKQIRQGIRQRDWGAAFIDEGSRFRNYSARTRTLQVLGQRARSRYVFSGNIMPRNPADSLVHHELPGSRDSSGPTTSRRSSPSTAYSAASPACRSWGYGRTR